MHWWKKLQITPNKRGIGEKAPTFVQNDFTPWCVKLMMYSALAEAGEGQRPDTNPLVNIRLRLCHLPPYLKDAIVSLQQQNSGTQVGQWTDS